jgi:peroxiredoxin
VLACTSKNDEFSRRGAIVAEFALLAVRLLLAFVFLLAGAAKFFDPLGLRKALREFGVPLALAKPSMVVLPVVEFLVGAVLVPASLAWYGACGALALLTLFLMALGISIIRGRKPACRCFGQLHSKPVGWPALSRDAALAACAAWLVSRGPLRLGPGFWAWVAGLHGQEKKAALVAAGLAGFLFFRLLDRARPERQTSESPLPPAIDDEDEEPRESATAPVQRPAPIERPSSAPRPTPAPLRRPVPASLPAPAKPSAQGIGLPIGTPAPEFELPAIAGGTRSLRSLREQGRDVLLVFSNPYCESCHALVPSLVRWTRELAGVLNIIVISRGPARDLLPKLKEFETSRILLQREFEIAEAYDCISTPTAVLVSADGLIRSELAVGREAIQQLIFPSSKRS